MNALLALRLSRRAIGAVVLDDEHIVFADTRHLTSNQERARIAADRYLAHLIDQIRPVRLAVYMPEHARALTAAVLDHLKQLSTASAIPLRVVTKPELLSVFGTTPLRNRQELHGIVECLWPTLAEVSNRVKPYLADAAATAWYADTIMAFAGT